MLATNEEVPSDTLLQLLQSVSTIQYNI